MNSPTKSLPLPAPTTRRQSKRPRYEAGWMPNIVNGKPSGYIAFLRPYSADWYDLYRRPTWWEALETALRIAQTTPDCDFVGGPDQ